MPDNEDEHPFGDIGQLTLLGLCFILWVGDSFFLRASTFMSDFVSAYIRLVLAASAIAVAAWLAVSGHTVVHPEGRKNGVVSTGAFQYVRHPLYLASVLFYLCLSVALYTVGQGATFQQVRGVRLLTLTREPGFAGNSNRAGQKH